MGSWRALVGIAAGLLLAAAGPPPALEAEFRARDQALLDAVGKGDRALWDRTLAADARYVDEEGNILSRKDLLDQIRPLPSGVGGHIAISDYRLQVAGDLATVIHRDDEQEAYFGHDLHAQYLTTETWRREGATWKLAMTHVYAVNMDPLAVGLPAADLDALVGRYSAAVELINIVTRDGDHLAIGREGRPARPFLAAGRDLFFKPGQPRFIYLVQRDADGRVTGLLEHREGQNILWKRLP